MFSLDILRIPIKNEVFSWEVLRIQKNEPKNEGEDKKNDKTRSTADIKSSKTHLPNAWQSFWVDLESQKGSQETPKSARKEPKRAPERSQDHLRI